MSIPIVDAWVVTVVRCLVEKRNHEGYKLNEYGDTYEKMVETDRGYIIEIIRLFLNHLS